MTRNGIYDVAQVCLNGHLINSSTKMEPAHNKEFCPKCGERTIINCEKCTNQIDGVYYIRHLNQFTEKSSLRTSGYFILPLFCPKCGVPFPWTERKIEASKNLISDEANLTKEEKELFAKSIDDIVRDTPETANSSRKIKKLLSKVGKGALTDMRKIFVDIVSETAKKILFP